MQFYSLKNTYNTEKNQVFSDWIIILFKEVCFLRDIVGSNFGVMKKSVEGLYQQR